MAVQVFKMRSQDCSKDWSGLKQEGFDMSPVPAHPVALEGKDLICFWPARRNVCSVRNAFLTHTIQGKLLSDLVLVF